MSLAGEPKSKHGSTMPSRRKEGLQQSSSQISQVAGVRARERRLVHPELRGMQAGAVCIRLRKPLPTGAMTASIIPVAQISILSRKLVQKGLKRKIWVYRLD
jgi:hypothetical protein